MPAASGRRGRIRDVKPGLPEVCDNGSSLASVFRAQTQIASFLQENRGVSCALAHRRTSPLRQACADHPTLTSANTLRIIRLTDVCERVAGGKSMITGERPQDWIIEKLAESTSTAPAELMEKVMADARCPAFGPIHHFIVGATLLACWHNAEAAANREAALRADLEEMLARSSSVPGATCARWGVCGAAASAGMAYAIVRGNAPLREEGWQEGQLMVSDLLARIARSGRPRCCKRDSRVAIAAAVAYFNALGGPQMTQSAVVPTCASFGENSVCMGSECPYHPSASS